MPVRYGTSSLVPPGLSGPASELTIRNVGSTDTARVGELITADLDAAPYTLTAPTGTATGQRFGVHTWNGGGTLTVSFGQQFVHPFTRTFPVSGTVLMQGQGMFFSWVFNQYYWALENPLQPLDRQQTLTASSTITFNPLLGENAVVTLNQAGHTLDFVTGGLALGNAAGLGKRGYIYVKQDGTGSRTITTYTAADYPGLLIKFPGGVKPVLSAAANAVDTIEWHYPSQGGGAPGIYWNLHQSNWQT